MQKGAKMLVDQDGQMYFPFMEGYVNSEDTAEFASKGENLLKETSDAKTLLGSSEKAGNKDSKTKD